MSKQTSAKSSSTNGSAQSWAQPYAQQAVGSIQGVFNQNQPQLQQLTDLTNSSVVNPLVSQFQASQGTAGQANQYNSDVLSGKYLNGNPYTSGIIDQLNRGVSDNVNSQFEGSGRYGSGAQANVLSRNLADADNQVMYNDYNSQMGRMDTAAQQATGSNASNAAQLMAAIGGNASLPYVGATAYGNSLGTLFNGGTSTATQTNPSPIWGALGAGLGAAGSIFQGQGTFSDARLKTNIELLHRDPDGLGWYAWNWRADPNGEKAKGVLAHEVKDIRPAAYVPNYRGSGFDAVNYAAL